MVQQYSDLTYSDRDEALLPGELCLLRYTVHNRACLAALLQEGEEFGELKRGAAESILAIADACKTPAQRVDYLGRIEAVLSIRLGYT
jgi:hypothetical protein